MRGEHFDNRESGAAAPTRPVPGAGQAKSPPPQTYAAGGSPAGRPGRTFPAAQLLALQRAIGNKHVGRLLGSRPVQRAGGQQPAASTPAELIAKHTTLGFLDEEGLAKELAAQLPNSADLINGVFAKLGDTDCDDVALELTTAMAGKLTNIPEQLRLTLIKHMVSGIVTDAEEIAIDNLWNSFGWDRMAELAVVPGNRELWRKSLAESEQLSDRVLKPTVEKFRWDVVAIARSYLDQNKEEVRIEGQRIGVDVTGRGGADPAKEQRGYVSQLMKMVPMLVKLRADREELLNLNVGYNTSGQGRSAAGMVPAPYRPGKEPTFPPSGKEQPPMPTYARINSRYEEATSVIAAFANLYPSIYALMQQNRLEEVASAKNAAAATKVIGETLAKTHQTIITADRMLKEGDGQEGEEIQYYDLVPLHTKLFDGSEKGRRPWNEPFWSGLARTDLNGKAARDFWTGLGVGLVTAAALIAAPLTGGATAAILIGGSLAVGTAQAAASWEKYANLSTAANATVRDELALVSQGQVDEALISAIMDTIAVVLDAYGAKAGTAAARATLTDVDLAETALKEAAAQQAKKRAIRSAIKEGSITVGTTAAAAAAHELADSPPVITDAKAQISKLRPNSTPVQQLRIQRQTTIQRQPTLLPPAPDTYGPEFEDHAIGALRRGEIPDIPPMTHVFPGQYNKQGWGIDLIGVYIDPVTGETKLCVFECKYVAEGRIAELGESAAGVRGGAKVTQGGRAWTENAANQLMNSAHPEAVAARNNLLKVLNQGRSKPLTNAEVVSLITRADFYALVPEGRTLERIIAQVYAMRRWGRAAFARHVRMP